MEDTSETVAAKTTIEGEIPLEDIKDGVVGTA
jgi:hypothetical protein